MKQILPSDTYVWSTGGGSFVPKIPWQQARGTQRFPVVTGILIQARITGTTGASGFSGQNVGCLFPQLSISDAQGNILNLTGYQLRLLNQLYYGERFVDPADIGASAGSASYDYEMFVPFAATRARKALDTAIPISCFDRQSNITLTLPSATPDPNGAAGLTITAATYTMQVYCYDTRTPRLHSRLVRQQVGLQANRALAALNAWVRSLTLYTPPAATQTGGGSTASLGNLSMAVLGVVNQPTTARLRDYRETADCGFASNDLVLGQKAEMLIIPDRDQRATDLDFIRDLSPDFAVGTGIGSTTTLIMEGLTPRSPELDAICLSNYSEADLSPYRDTLLNFAKLDTASKGNARLPSEWLPERAAIMPIEFSAAVVASVLRGQRR